MSKRTPVIYHETQAFGRRYSGIILAIPPAALIFITCRQWIWHQQWGNSRIPTSGLAALSILLVLVYLRLITVRLVTDLRPRELQVRLSGLLWKRKIPLDRIRTARAIAYDAIRDFGGYGIRSGLRGKAYIASGSGGVELELQSGSRLLIGSQQPAQLARVITAWRLAG